MHIINTRILRQKILEQEKIFGKKVSNCEYKNNFLKFNKNTLFLPHPHNALFRLSKFCNFCKDDIYIQGPTGWYSSTLPQANSVR